MKHKQLSTLHSDSSNTRMHCILVPLAFLQCHPGKAAVMDGVSPVAIHQPGLVHNLCLSWLPRPANHNHRTMSAKQEPIVVYWSSLATIFSEVEPHIS